MNKLIPVTVYITKESKAYLERNINIPISRWCRTVINIHITYFKKRRLKRGLLKRINWNKLEVEILKQFYSSIPNRILSIMFNRSTAVIREKALNLKIRKEKNYRSWMNI